MKVITVVGARPQFIKAAAVSRALTGRQDCTEVMIHTGQHFDANMSDVFFDELDIPPPKHNLGIGGHSHAQNTGRAMLVPNAALRFRPETEEEAGGGVFNPQIGLEDGKQQASIGEGSRQVVQVLQADGTLKPVEVVTGRSDGRRTVVTSKGLKPGMKVVTGIKAAAQ